MKHLTIILIFFATVNNGYAQLEAAGIHNYEYIKVGVSTLGGSLSADLSPTGNILAGNYGARTGFALETGKIFYLHKNSLSDKFPIKIGLDWTVIGTQIHKLSWNDYYRERNGPGDPDYHFNNILISTRLGPAFSVNPIERLIVDLRFQIAGVVQVNTTDYYENEGTPAEAFVTLIPEPEEGEAQSAVAQYLHYAGYGITPSFGITVRRKWIGLSLDYASGKIKTPYASDEGEGKAVMPFKNLLFSLSFSW